MSAYANQNHAPSFTCVRLEKKSVGKEVQEEKKEEHCSRISGCGKTVSGCSGAGSGSCEFPDSGAGNDHNTGDIRLWENHIDEDGEPSL